MPITAIAINCTLKADTSEKSSTDAMIAVLEKSFAKHEVKVSETIRIAAFDIKPGVSSDEGDGDEWPGIREKNSSP